MVGPARMPTAEIPRDVSLAEGSRMKPLSMTESPKKTVRRRTFLGAGLLATAAALLKGSPILSSLVGNARAADVDVVHDTLNGLLAFVVPGPDAYSVAQGVSTVEPGGLDAGVTNVLVEALDQSAPFLPHFSATVAAIMNNLAQVVHPVHPAADGAFLSPFAGLSFAEKVAVFQIMDGTDSLKPLAGVLPVLAAALCYSEAGVFEPATRSLTAQPVGWIISSYTGVADGRDEFQGYFDNRRVR
jgi:hypothetical protein